MIPKDCFFDIEEGKLQGNIGTKVRNYLKNGLIRATENPSVFIVLPSKGRNQKHIVFPRLNECTCQRNANGLECSHLIAVKVMLRQIDNGERKYPRPYIY